MRSGRQQNNSFPPWTNLVEKNKNVCKTNNTWKIEFSTNDSSNVQTKKVAKPIIALNAVHPADNGDDKFQLPHGLIEKNEQNGKNAQSGKLNYTN